MTSKPVTGIRIKVGEDGRTRVTTVSAPTSVSRKIAQRKSTKRTVVSPAKAGRVK